MGLFRFICKLFELKKVLSTFQLALGIILSTVHRQFAMFYLDAIVIFSKSLRTHIKHVRHMLTYLVVQA